MINLSKANFRDRQRGIRMQRNQTGKLQLSPHRRGPLVPDGASTSDYEEFNGDPGFHVHKNRKNRFACIRWHYKEDPDKRDPEFEVAGRKKNPNGWDQEMEIDFGSKKGVKVFAEFSWRRAECDLGPYWSSQSNIIMPTLAPPEWWPLYLATDPGRRAAWATLFVLVDQYGCWHIFKSLLKTGLHYKEAKRIVASLQGRRYVVEHVIDAASKQARTDSLKTLMQKMADPPFKMDCIPIEHNANEYIQIEELRERMQKRPDGRFGMYIWDTVANQGVITQFKNTVYRDDKGEKILSEDVDAVDAAKYLATHQTGRAIVAKKPVEEMTDREFRTHLATKRRRGLEKAMSSRQSPNSYMQDESYDGAVI